MHPKTDRFNKPILPIIVNSLPFGIVSKFENYEPDYLYKLQA